MIEIIAGRTNLTEEQVAEFFEGSETVTARFAEQTRVVQEIKEFCVPAGAPVIQIGSRQGK